MLTTRCSPVVVALNDSEIAILGGKITCRNVGDIIVYDTTAGKFTQILEECPYTFLATGNQSSNVGQNEIVALV